MNVVITGAAGGLGIEIAKQTLERNDNVWAFDIKKNLKIEELEDSEYSDNLHPNLFLQGELYPAVL